MKRPVLKKKKQLNERFQELAGIKPLSIHEVEVGDKQFSISSPAESAIETRDINTTIIKLYDEEAREDVGFVQLNVMDLMSRGVDKVGKPEVYEAWAVFHKALESNNVQGV